MITRYFSNDNERGFTPSKVTDAEHLKNVADARDVIALATRLIPKLEAMHAKRRVFDLTFHATEDSGEQAKSEKSG